MKIEGQPHEQYAFLRSPRCGAKTRSGTPCKSPAMTNGRCRLHGGKSTGPPKGNQNAFKHGLYSRDAIERRRYIRQLFKDSQALFQES
ncbi:MAG: HGGxSTG domain-containing protein [Pseudomonadota bacterium]